MSSKLTPVSKLIINEANPRFITDSKFAKLVQSIKDLPDMLNLRPIMTNDEGVILGGNMRFRACIEAGLTEVPVSVVTRKDTAKTCKRRKITYEQLCDELVIKDNVGFGSWDWDMLANTYKTEKLEAWGMDVVKHDWEDLGFIDEDIKTPSLEKDTIVIKVDEAEMKNIKQITMAVAEFLKENFNGCEIK